MILNCVVLYCIVICCIALYYIVLHCIVLNCIVLFCIVLYCIVLYCIEFYYIVLHTFVCFVSFFIYLSLTFLMLQNCIEDETLISEARNCNPRNANMVIFDARSMLAAGGNRLKVFVIPLGNKCI